MGRQGGRWRAGERMKARTLSRRTRRICCGTSPYLLFFFLSFLFRTLVSAIFAFFARRAAAGSPETATTYSEKRQPVFHAVSPFCLPAASRDSFPFSSFPDSPRPRKTSRRAWEFKGTAFPATSADVDVADEGREKKEISQERAQCKWLLSIHEILIL